MPTVCRFLSGQWLAFSTTVTSEHRHLIACLWCKAVQNGGGLASRYCLFTLLLRKQRFPFDAVLTDVTGSRSPGHGKTGVSDIAGH